MYIVGARLNGGALQVLAKVLAHFLDLVRLVSTKRAGAQAFTTTSALTVNTVVALERGVEGERERGQHTLTHTCYAHQRYLAKLEVIVVIGESNVRCQLPDLDADLIVTISKVGSG